MNELKISTNTYYIESGIRSVLKIAFPMIVSSASHSIILFCDRIFLSRVSIGALAASMPAGLTTFTFTALFFGILSFVTTLAAQYYGANKPEKSGAAAWQGIYISGIAYIILLISIPLGYLYFKTLKMDASVYEYAKPYFTILMCGSIFMLLNNALSSFFAGIGETKIVMYSNIIGMFINIPINYILIFGLPENNFINFNGAGIVGAAIASVIATIITFIILAKRFWNKKTDKKFSTKKNWRFDFEIFKKLIIHGGHSGIEFFLNILSFNMFIFIIGSIGLIEQAAVNITFSWNLIAFLPLIGIAVATTSLVGKNMGANKIELAEKAVYSSLKISFIFISFMAVFYVFFPELLVGVFCPADNPDFLEVSMLSNKMLKLITIYIFSDILLIVFAGALRGAGDTKFIMFTSIFAHWFILTIPSAILVYVFKTDAITVWWMFIIFSIILSALYLYRFLNGKWKKIKLIDLNVKETLINPFVIEPDATVTLE